jgi:Flp pilus assembly protein TadB
MTVVPLGVLALLAVTDAGVRAALASRAGAVIVGVGLVLNALGGWWMHRIIDGATR